MIFVLAHGSWHGGWCWQRVAQRLQALGHTVAAPSYTGMGERAHLLGPAITLDTFIDDLVQVIEHGEYEDVVLVGHSFGGVPITGVADRIPAKLRHLVFLDSLVVESGQAPFDMYPPDEAALRIEAAQRSGGLTVPVPQPLPAGWGLAPGSDDYRWAMRRLSPHPLRSYTSALRLQAPVGNGVPKTYIECTHSPSAALASSRDLVKSQPGWNVVQLAAPHDAMITHPQAVLEHFLAL